MKKNFTRILSVVLAIAMVLCCVPFASASSGEISGSNTLNYQISNPSFATISDLHVYTEDLVKNGSKDYKSASDSATMLGESFPVLNAALTTIEKSVKERGLRYIFLTGDLSSYGEKLCHERLAQLLRSFQNKMRKEYDPKFHIFVIPGNHDINYYDGAKAYDADGNVIHASDSKEAAEELNTSSAQFAYIYRELGYGAEDQLAGKIKYYKSDIGLDTFTTDNPCKFDDAYANLSYSVDLEDANGQDMRLVAVDGCIYSSDVTSTFVTIDGQKYAHQETGCYMDDAHLNWICAQSKDGVAKNEAVVGITHFAVVPQFTLQAAVIKMFIYDNWQSMATKLADAGMHYIFSGHVHSNDVSAYTSADGNTIYDLETGSMANYMNSYRENRISLDADGKIGFKTVTRACDADSTVDLSKVWYDYNEDGTPNYIAMKYNLDPNGNPYKKISRPFSDNYGLYLFLGKKLAADANGDTITTDANGDKIKPSVKEFATNTVKNYLDSGLVDDIINAGGTKAYIEDKLGSSIEDFLSKYITGDTFTVSVITLKKSDILKLADLLFDEIDSSFIGSVNTGKADQKLISTVTGLIDDLLNYKIAGYTLDEIATQCMIDFYSGEEGRDNGWTNVDMSKVYTAFTDENSTTLKGLMDYLFKILLGYTTTDASDKEVKVDGALISLLGDFNISVDMINSVLPDFAGILRYPALRKLLLGSADKAPSIINIVDNWAGKIITDKFNFQTFATGEVTETSVTDTASLAEYFIFNLADDYLTDSQIHKVSLLFDSSLSSFCQDPLFEDKSNIEGDYPFIDNYDLKTQGLVSGYDSAATIDAKTLTPKTADNAWYQIPDSVSVSFGSDTTSTKNINWFTIPQITGTDVQIIPYKANASASDFASANLVNANISTSCKTIRMIYPTMDIGTYALGESMDMSRHTASVTSLSAGTKYTYRVGDASKNIWTEPAAMQTSEGDSSAFSFLYMTDSQSQSQEQYDSSYGKLLKNAFGNYSDARFILHTGDMVDYGANMLQWSWALGENGIADTTIASTAGNHEPKGTNGTDGMLSTAFGPAQDTFFNISHTQQDVADGIYYAFDYNDVHVMVLNTNNLNSDNTLSEDQLNWLAQSAASSDATWKVVAMHKSIYSNASHFDDTDVCALRSQLSKLMPQLGIDLVLSGHDHVFVRSEFMTNGNVSGTFDGSGSATNQSGTVYLINGKSGVKDYNLKSDDAVNALFDLKDMKTVKVTGQDSYSAVSINGGAMTVKTYLLSTDGSSSSVIDSFTINKTKLETPANVKAATASTTSIKLSWNAVTGCNAYQVYRATSATGTFSKIATVSSASFTDTSLSAGTTYYYKVIAGTNKLQSAASAVVSAKATLAAVQHFRASKKSTTTIQTSWSKLTSAKTYKLYLSTSKTSGYKLAATTASTNYVIKNLTKGKTYYIQIRANNGTTDGILSEPVAVKM